MDKVTTIKLKSLMNIADEAGIKGSFSYNLDSGWIFKDRRNSGIISRTMMILFTTASREVAYVPGKGVQAWGMFYEVQPEWVKGNKLPEEPSKIGYDESTEATHPGVAKFVRSIDGEDRVFFFRLKDEGDLEFYSCKPNGELIETLFYLDSDDGKLEIYEFGNGEVTKAGLAENANGEVTIG